MGRKWEQVINKFDASMWKTSYFVENYFFSVKILSKNSVNFTFCPTTDQRLISF